MVGKRYAIKVNKHVIFAIITAAAVLSLCACAQTVGNNPSDTSPVVSENVSETTAAAALSREPSPEQTVETTAVPYDLLGDELNVFSDVSFPEGYTVYAAEYSINADGMDYYFYTLYLTAQGQPEEIITYLSKLVGDSAQESISQNIDYFNNDGGVGIDGIIEDTGIEVACKVLPTEKDVYDYDYIEGCDVWLQAVLRDGNDKYNDIFENSFNLNALAQLSDFVDLSGITGRKSVYVRALRGDAQIDAVYNVENLPEVADRIKELNNNQNDDGSYFIELPDYGDIGVSLFMDINSNDISVFQSLRDSAKCYCDYETEISYIQELGFKPDDEGNEGRYIYHDKSGRLWVSVSVADLGGEGDEVLFFKELGEYVLAVWFYPEEQVFWVQVNNDDTEAKYAYHVSDGSITDEYSNTESVESIFRQALANENVEDIYMGPLAMFSNYVNETFSMSIDDLFQTAAGASS